ERACTGGDGTAPRSIARQDFRDQEHLVATTRDRLRDDEFRIAVHFRGVDVSHAEIEPALERGDRFAAIAAVEIPGSLPDDRHMGGAMAEGMCSHVRLLR